MKNICAFLYDFSHSKGQNGLLKLATTGNLPKLILAQPKKKLPPNLDSIGVVPKDSQALCDPRKLFGILQVPYLVCDHDSEEAHECIKKYQCDFGVILGSRILKKPTIDCFSHGVLNMHPGVLPGNRGLANLKRAILLDMDPAVTFHLVDEKIDAGRMLFVERVPVYANDSIQTIFMRHQTVELNGMIKAIEGLRSGTVVPMPFDPGEYNKDLGDSCDEQVMDRFPEWKRKRVK